TIAKADQTISFGPLASKAYGDAPFAVSATASSGLPVSFAAAGACTVAGSTVTITGAGACTVTASQAGDSNHNAAPGVQQGFSIARAPLTVAASNQQMVLHASVPALTVGYSGFVNGDTSAGVTGLACTTTATSSSPVGAYPITCSGATDPNYALSYKGGTLTVTYQIKALYNQTTVSKSGTNVAIKLQVQDAKGKNLSSSGVVVTLSTPALAPSPSPGAQPSGTFTFTPTGDAGPMYQSNVKTTGYPKGTYTLSFTVAGDPLTHTVQFLIG